MAAAECGRPVSDEADEDRGVARETPATPSSLPARFLLFLISAYRRWISPLTGPRCRYYPTCSSYAASAITDLGALRGTVVAAWRVMRCNPLSSGGFDHLEDRKLFRRTPPTKPSATRPEVTQA